MIFTFPGPAPRTDRYYSRSLPWSSHCAPPKLVLNLGRPSGMSSTLAPSAGTARHTLGIAGARVQRGWERRTMNVMSGCPPRRQRREERRWDDGATLLQSNLGQDGREALGASPPRHDL